ncbi:hypothetical protein BH11ACT6_BH11ACT6_05090 [soil metagenome]
MTICFHTTDSAGVILRGGFRDHTSTYMLGVELTGIFIADRPLDANEGCKGDQVLQLTLPDTLDLDAFELMDESGYATYREWCVPAALLNTELLSIRLLTVDEVCEL